MTNEEIKQWRKRCGFTQKVAASKLGITDACYRQMEAGKSYRTGKPVVVAKRTALAMLAIEHLPKLADKVK